LSGSFEQSRLFKKKTKTKNGGAREMSLDDRWQRALEDSQRVNARACDETVTVFFQGLGASRAQAAQYFGPEGIELPGGGAARMDKAPRLLYNLFPRPEIAEIGYGFDLNPLHWLMLGWTSVQNWWRGVRGDPPHFVRLNRLEMAADNNVSDCLLAVRACIAANPTRKKIVLFGTSRGAATAFLTLCRLSAAEREHIAFAVFEGMPDSADGVLLERSRFPRAMSALFYGLSAQPRLARSPIVATLDYPDDVPALFVTSKTDDVVPPQCTERVIRVLQRRGINLRHVELERSRHSMMATSDPLDQTTYHLEMSLMYQTCL
jgi:dienelactone hydrolase